MSLTCAQRCGLAEEGDQRLLQSGHMQSTCFKRECALAFGLPEIGDSSENTLLP